MAVYYKFKSAKDYDSICLDVPFISVGELKNQIFVSKIGKGKDFDILITNAQTNEEYPDEEMLIPKNTSVIIRRIPGLPRPPIVVTKQDEKLESKIIETKHEEISLPATNGTSGIKYHEDSNWNEFIDGFDTIPDVLPVQTSNIVQGATPTNKDDEDSKIKGLNDLNWQCLGFEFGNDAGKGKGRWMGARSGFGFGQKTPPQGYVCHRCKVPGHFIQYCPTNGDSNYDIKRVKKPTGIPQSMLVANPHGSYALPNGTVAVLRPNEAAFDKEMEGLSSTRSVGDLPPELCCPICKNVMKDAVLSSKCCFKSFCDKCIRDYITSKSMCICGATKILADYLLPNKTLRDTINRILESGNSSTENSGITFQDTESAHSQPPKILPPTSSAASKGEPNSPKVSPANGGTTNIQEAADERKVVSAPQQKSEKETAAKDADASEVTHESMSVKESTSKGSGQMVKGEMQQKLVPTEAGKTRKNKRVYLPANDLQRKTSQDLGSENYMMPMVSPLGYNSFWNGMQPNMEGFMGPYASPMQMMGYFGLGTFDMPFTSVPSQHPFGMQMLPVVPPHTHRDHTECSMGLNVPPPVMHGVGLEARKADLRRRHENVRHNETERDFLKDREYGREVSCGGDVSPMKSKTVCAFYCLVSCLFFPGLVCAIYLYIRVPQACKRTPITLYSLTFWFCLDYSNYYLWLLLWLHLLIRSIYQDFWTQVDHEMIERAIAMVSDRRN